MRTATYLLLMRAVCLITPLAHQASAKVYNVVPDARSTDSNDDVYSLPDALDMAVGGDSITLDDGTYTDQIHSTHPGEPDNPRTISGTRGAVIKANDSPCIKITHSWITLEVRFDGGVLVYIR